MRNDEGALTEVSPETVPHKTNKLLLFQVLLQQREIDLRPARGAG